MFEGIETRLPTNPLLQGMQWNRLALRRAVRRRWRGRIEDRVLRTIRSEKPWPSLVTPLLEYDPSINMLAG